MPSILRFDVVKNVGVGGILGWFGGLTGKNSGQWGVVSGKRRWGEGEPPQRDVGRHHPEPGA
jgi:hypothetical protein